MQPTLISITSSCILVHAEKTKRAHAHNTGYLANSLDSIGQRDKAIKMHEQAHLIAKEVLLALFCPHRFTSDNFAPHRSHLSISAALLPCAQSICVCQAHSRHLAFHLAYVPLWADYRWATRKNKTFIMLLKYQWPTGSKRLCCMSFLVCVFPPLHEGC